MSAEQPLDAPGAGVAPAGQESVPPRGGTLASGPWTGIFSALLGGAVVWWLVQAYDPVFGLPEEMSQLNMYSPAEKLRERDAAQKVADLHNAMAALGLFGMLVGGALALGEGVARRSLKTALAGTVLCASVGALFGSLAGLLGHFAYLYYLPVQDVSDLAKTIRVQVVMLGVLGGGAGLGLGMLGASRRSVLTCLPAGVLGGVLAGMLYPFLTANFLPVAFTELVIPRGAGNRLLWIGLTAGLLGLTIPGLSLRRGPRKSPAPPDPQTAV
jgi:hypothetical protein